MVLSGSLAMAQSHFMYIQSEEGTPFYIKMKDSILSSTQSGYLVLNQVKKGTYPIIVGFAKKKVPEAAFKIVIDNSGDKGYLLRTIGGKLQLVNIQSNQVLQPAEVATSAGNRILPSTIAGIGKKQTEQSEGEVPADPLASHTGEEKPAEAQSTPEENPFETMLNAVTGGSTPSVPPTENKTTERDTPLAEEPPVTSDVATVAPPDEKIPEPEEKKKEPSFFDLLNPEAGSTATKEKQAGEQVATPETTSPQPASPPANTAADLTFIDFSPAADGQQHDERPEDNRLPNVQQDENPYNDTIITSGKELRRWKRQQRLAEQEKNNSGGSLFDRLLEKVDTAVVDSGSSSVASPLLGDKQRRQEQALEANGVLCSEIADAQYFNKVRRKVAAKKSAEAMLRTANRYLSDDKCFTVSQIKQLAYLFPTDDFRLQFLKTAYLHCSEKDNYESLVQTLSSQHYQNRLKDYIR